MTTSTNSCGFVIYRTFTLKKKRNSWDNETFSLLVLTHNLHFFFSCPREGKKVFIFMFHFYFIIISRRNTLLKKAGLPPFIQQAQI